MAITVNTSINRDRYLDSQFIADIMWLNHDYEDDITDEENIHINTLLSKDTEYSEARLRDDTDTMSRCECEAMEAVLCRK